MALYKCCIIITATGTSTDILIVEPGCCTFCKFLLSSFTFDACIMLAVLRTLHWNFLLLIYIEFLFHCVHIYIRQWPMLSGWKAEDTAVIYGYEQWKYAGDRL